MYILKTKSQPSNLSSNFVGNSSDIEARILAKLEKKKEEEKIAQEIKIKEDLAIEGEKYYIKKCQSCHGNNGELKAQGYSRPLNSLTLEELKDSIKGYTNGNYNRGMAEVMAPISNSITYKDIDSVHAYLNKLNKK